MTDNRTTELREKLDALGIEHFDYDKGGRTQTMWESPEDMRHFTYETAANPAKTAKLIIEWFPTPDQAIAATLRNETLTAEQVREAIESNSWAETSSIREFNDSSWQAIADELNAENDGLKARIESLRSKLSKMLDAASAIQHIGDLP